MKQKQVTLTESELFFLRKLLQGGLVITDSVGQAHIFRMILDKLTLGE